MRVIPAKANDWGELATLTARLCIDPNSLETTSALDDELYGHVIGNVVNAIGIANAPLDQREFDLVRRSSPSGIAMVNDNTTKIRDAFLAGRVLVKAMRIAHHLPKKASVAQAMKIVVYELSKGPDRLGIKSVKPAWARYKSVSHLTGAIVIAAKDLIPFVTAFCEIQEVAKRGFKTPTQKFTEQERKESLEAFNEIADPLLELGATAMARYFAHAERLRGYGEAFFAPGRSAHKGRSKHNLPLLDPAVMWTVPKTFSLPEVEVDFGPPLTDLELSILGKNK